jgi:hypothetical protein
MKKDLVPQGASCLYCLFSMSKCRFIGLLTGFLEIVSYFFDPRQNLVFEVIFLAFRINILLVRLSLLIVTVKWGDSVTFCQLCCAGANTTWSF